MRLDSLEQVRALAERILDPSRSEPVVCVTIRAHDAEPLIDVDALQAAVGELPVYVLPTGELTWELTSLLPDKFDVYGGAARIWWPGLSWDDEPRRHPLVFCWGPWEAPAALARVGRELTRWGWDVAAGTDQQPAEQETRTYTVLSAAPTAVTDDFPHLAGGQLLDGRVVEVYSNGVEVEISGGIRSVVLNRRGRTTPECRPGDTVQVQVVRVLRADRTVELCWPAAPEPEPSAQTPVPARTVSATPADLARRYEARTGTTAAGPAKQDPEPHTEASLKSLRDEAQAVIRELHEGLASARSRIEAFAAEQFDDVVAALSGEIDAARAEARSLRLQLDAAETDKRNAIKEMKKQRDRAHDAEKQAKKERDRRTHAEDKLNGHGVHEDPEAQLRHEIAVACERAAGSLGPSAARAYVLGPDFLSSLDALQGIGRPEVVEKIARMLLGAPNSYGHPLRTAEAGNNPHQVRASDSAKAYRLYLQQNTPAARRLHYWQLLDGSIELANVGVHDAIAIR